MRSTRVTAISMPFLVPLALMGIPANAWTRRAAESLLWGLGIVVKVADSTSRHDDMSVFQMWLRTDDPARIPSRCILVVEEARRRSIRCKDGLPDALWYPVEIVQEAPPVAPRLMGAWPPGGSPPSPPSLAEEDSDGLQGSRRRRGRSRSRRHRRGFAPCRAPARVRWPAFVRSSASSVPCAR